MYYIVPFGEGGLINQVVKNLDKETVKSISLFHRINSAI